MVWIHGGSLTNGGTSSDHYDGTRFAHGGVVLVSVAYRLGPFGFLAHPALSRESGKGSGAYGLRDLVAALAWVRGNIAQFGGDPETVTIFGQSAGAMAVSLLAGSPAAEGLFKRAISQSGGVFSEPSSTTRRAGGLRTLELAERTGEQLFSDLGAPDLAAARLVSASQILKAASGRGALDFWAVLDGDVLVAPNLQRYRAGRFNDTPVLVGSNSDEGAGDVPPGTSAKSFSELPRFAPPACTSIAATGLALYSHDTDAAAVRSFKDLSRDAGYGWNSWTWAHLHSRHGRSNAFIYYFDARTPQSPEGALHFAEVPYVFADSRVAARIEDARLSELMHRYWINFARTGDPNGPGLPRWPAFKHSSPLAMVFDRASSARPLPNLERMKVIDTFIECLNEHVKSR